MIYSLKNEPFVLYNRLIVIDSNIQNNQTFTEVDISEFYDTEATSTEQQEEGIVILTAKEQELYNQLLPFIEEAAPDRATIIKDRKICAILRLPLLNFHLYLNGEICLAEHEHLNFS